MIQNVDNCYKTDVPKESGNYRKRSFYTPPDIIEREFRNAILSKLLLTWTGCYTKAYGHLVNGRTLQDYVLIYCIDGFGWLKLKGKSWSIGKGDVFVCPPEIEHSYGADSKIPWTKYWIHFRGSNAEAYMELLGLSLESPVLHIGEDIKIISWLQDIFDALKTGYSQSNLLIASSYLNNILSHINSLLINKILNKDEDMNIDKIINYMLDNLNVSLTLVQLSNYSNLSKYHFSRLFKEKTGYAPVDYYIRLKMLKACELLESSNVKINSISSNLGFNNPYYFSIAFKRVIGQSPEHYREML